MSKLFAVMTLLLFVTGCEHVNFEIDWGLMLQSAAAYFSK